MLKSVPNARFWIWHKEGWVKLTLTPGQRVEFVAGGRTDEGYFSSADVYEHTGEHVERSLCSSGRDCDGPYESFEDAECPLSDLRAWTDLCAEMGFPPTPDWRQVGAASVTITPKQWAIDQTPEGVSGGK